MKGPADLDIPFLYRVMERMQELPWDREPVGSWEFVKFLPENIRDKEREARYYVTRHLEYLEEIGLLDLGARSANGSTAMVKLTVDGRHFVQPELAEFAMQVTSSFISEVESQVESSNLPTEEKEDFRFRLRKTFSDAAPDLAYKLIMEVLVRMAQL